ncbi:hypothetical protein N9M75_03120, partial [Schleiferiaceae bacterium]|nr:hypothetical protein [Schleiferiaceae bacterium]
IGMCQYLEAHGVIAVDNQLPTEHLDRLGAMNIDREEFLEVMLHHAGLVSEDATIPRSDNYRLSL